MAPSRAAAAALVLALGAMACAAAARPADATVRLTDVSVGRRGEALVVEVKTSGAPTYTTTLLGGPVRLVLDFEDAEYRWSKAWMAVGADPVKEIRGSQYLEGVARIVVELTRKAPYTLERHAEGLRVVFGSGAAPAAAPGPVKPAPTVPPATPASPAPARAPAPSKASAATPQFKLEGTVLGDDGSIAYIADTAANRVGVYRVGDRLGDAVVEAIEERHVVLRTPRGAVELRLEGPRFRR